MTITATPARSSARSERAVRRLFTTARCRFAEDCLAEAVSSGIRQVVLHGPCLDTFARHNPYPHVRVFDIRHPDSDIETALSATDFDPGQPSFLIWLEDAPTLAATLRYAAGLSAGTQLVFDHTAPAAVVTRTLHEHGFDTLDHLDAATLAARYLDHAPAHPGPHVVRAARRRLQPAGACRP